MFIEIGDLPWSDRWRIRFIAGMIVGAALYAEAYPFLKETVLTWGDFGKLTLPQALGISPWLVIPVMIIGGLALFRFFEKKGL